MKKISFSVLSMCALVACLCMSCQSNSNDAIKDAARQELEGANANAVTTSNPSTTTVPAANAATETVPTGPLTAVEFAETKHDYGMIEAGEKVAYTFEFKNTGNEPLVLSNVKPSCGCTTPSWTKEPIAPGDMGSIDVEFDSKGKSGKQTKTVTVTANTDPAKTVLTITGDVQKAEAL